jgi:hypothetical protein
MNKITQKILKDLVYYDPSIGEFRWKNRDMRWFDSESTMKMWNNRFANTVTGTIRKDGYVKIVINYNQYLAHRLAWLYVYGKWPENQIDHVNGVRNDNRIKNLRECTKQQNCFNSRIPNNNTSGYKGVSFNKRCKKYECYIKHNQVRIHLGRFDNPEDAHTVYCKKAEELFGEFWNNGEISAY